MGARYRTWPRVEARWYEHDNRDALPELDKAFAVRPDETLTLYVRRGYDLHTCDEAKAAPGVDGWWSVGGCGWLWLMPRSPDPAGGNAGADAGGDGGGT